MENMSVLEQEEFLSAKNKWVEIFDELGIPKTTDYLPNSGTASRVLTICRGGNCRSVATAFLLKYKWMYNSLSASFEKNSYQTLKMLIGWANLVVVFEKEHYNNLCPLYEHKLILIELDKVERLRARPFEIPFLKELDKKLKEVFGEPA